MLHFSTGFVAMGLVAASLLGASGDASLLAAGVVLGLATGATATGFATTTGSTTTVGGGGVVDTGAGSCLGSCEELGCWLRCCDGEATVTVGTVVEEEEVGGGCCAATTGFSGSEEGDTRDASSSYSSFGTSTVIGCDLVLGLTRCAGLGRNSITSCKPITLSE